MDIFREINDRKGEGNSLGNRGNAYAALGEKRKASQLCEQALVIDREIGCREYEGNDFFNLSLVYDKLGEREKAIDYAETALTIYEAIESPYIKKVKKQLDLWE